MIVTNKDKINISGIINGLYSSAELVINYNYNDTITLDVDNVTGDFNKEIDLPGDATEYFVITTIPYTNEICEHVPMAVVKDKILGVRVTEIRII